MGLAAHKYRSRCLGAPAQDRRPIDPQNVQALDVEPTAARLHEKLNRSGAPQPRRRATTSPMSSSCSAPSGTRPTRTSSMPASPNVPNASTIPSTGPVRPPR